jgi:hypothetical protein
MSTRKLFLLSFVTTASFASALSSAMGSPIVTMERGTEVKWTSVEGKTYRPQWS